MRRTAKGDLIDFDLIKAKQQMESKPAPEEVSVRQSIIDRRLRKKVSKMTPSPLNNVAEPQPEPIEVLPKVDEVVTVENTKKVLDNPPPRKQKTKAKHPSGDDT